MGGGSKIGQICRWIVVKNCRRRGVGVKKPILNLLIWFHIFLSLKGLQIVFCFCKSTSLIFFAYFDINQKLLPRWRITIVKKIPVDSEFRIGCCMWLTRYWKYFWSRALGAILNIGLSLLLAFRLFFKIFQGFFNLFFKLFQHFSNFFQHFFNNFSAFFQHFFTFLTF